jgi:hypothetical protein
MACVVIDLIRAKNDFHLSQDAVVTKRRLLAFGVGDTETHLMGVPHIHQEEVQCSRNVVFS